MADYNYYTMPDGSETIAQSRWLTSNGGQATQYVTRATRIDGVFKEDPIEDLNKAKYFINDEIERLTLLKEKGLLKVEAS